MASERDNNSWEDAPRDVSWVAWLLFFYSRQCKEINKGQFVEYLKQLAKNSFHIRRKDPSAQLLSDCCVLMATHLRVWYTDNSKASFVYVNIYQSSNVKFAYF